MRCFPTFASDIRLILRYPPQLLPVSQSSSQVACQTRNAEFESLTDLGLNHICLLPPAQFVVRTVTALVATAHKELPYLLDGWWSGTSTERADLFEREAVRSYLCLGLEYKSEAIWELAIGV